MKTPDYPSTTKRCPVCQETKRLNGFSLDKAFKSGYNSRCKSCSSIRQAEWRKNNLERSREHSRLSAVTFRRNHPERAKETVRKCYQKRKANQNN